MNNNQQKYYLNNGVRLLFESNGNASHWFGYYNYCPIDIKGDKLLAHRFECETDRAFDQNDTIEVGWFSLQDGSWHPVSCTRACNWQQGAMTQWVHIDGQQRIIFNDVQGNLYVSKIYNTDGTIYKTLPHAVYGINEREHFSITMSFERAYWCRAYHYEYIRDESLNSKITELDGIYRLDLNTGEYKKIIDMETILKINYSHDFDGAKHWVEHIMLNPSGTKFAFYHRFDPGNGYKTRCLVADVNGGNLIALPDWETNSWSHLGWRSDDEFVIFGVKRKALGNVAEAVTKTKKEKVSVLRKIYRKYFARFVSPQMHNRLVAGSHYQHYCIKDGIIKKLEPYEKDLLVNDGHPSFSKDARFMLTDTYADSEHFRHLLMYDIKKKHLHRLGRFYSPINECGYRSDLHPRFACNDNLIVIDSAHGGRHQIVVLTVDLKKL